MSSLRTNDTHSDGVGMFALRMDRWKVEVELTVVVEKKCVLKNSQLVPKCRHKKEVPPKTKSEILFFVRSWPSRAAALLTDSSSCTSSSKTTYYYYL